MARLGRVVAVLIPWLFTIASLAWLSTVIISSVYTKHNSGNTLYFVRVDLANLTDPDVSSQLSSMASSALKNLTEAKELLADLEKAETSSNIRDFYDIGFLGYCAGNKTSKGDYVVDYCSHAKSMFWFDPVTVWGLNGTGAEALLPDSLKDGLKVYEKASKWMFVAYMIAFAATLIEILVSISAFFSRIGSLITSLISGVSTTFTLLASITATALFVTLDGAFTTSLKEYQVHSTIGSRLLVFTWLAFICSLVSGMFWAFTSCCCSAQSRTKAGQYIIVEKAPTYERVASPYSGAAEPMLGGGHPAHVTPSAYEPFRHVPENGALEQKGRSSSKVF